MHFEIVFVVLFTVATTVALLARWLNVPYTVALVVAGLFLGSLRVLEPPHLTRELLYTIVLPGLLFDAAFRIDLHEFWRNKMAVNLLAFPGAVLAIALTGAILAPALRLAHLDGLGGAFTLRHGLIFGTIVAATDPIAVVAMFRVLRSPRRLVVLAEGESLLNDGTAVVLLPIVLAMAGGGRVDLPGAVLEFVRVVGTGFLVGAVVGVSVAQIIRRIEDPMVEITLTVIAAYGSFAAAENLHTSGVVATVTAGLLSGSYLMREALSPRSRPACDSFWEYIAFALNSVVFLLIGFTVKVQSLLTLWRPALLAFAAVTLSRALIVFAASALLRPTRERIPWSWSLLLTWGGLRGALSMVLALGLPADLPHRELLVTMTFGVVVLSILLQGLTMAPLLRLLGEVGHDPTGASFMNVLDWLLGKPLSTDEADHQHIGPLAGVPVLGLDALSSAAYGPEAALTLLLPLGVAGLAYVGPISALIIGILLIVYFSYQQTIKAYPGGGGSYTVARENLGERPSLLAAAALALDYILNVAVGISAGVGALVSAVPGLQPHMLVLCLVILVLLTLINLRGVRESGVVFMLPTYAFVATLLVMIVVGLVRTVLSGGHPAAVVAPPAIPKAAEAAGLWLLTRAFASGCTAMTGVEAVSNGVPLFRAPAIPRAQRTLTLIIAILVALLGGIAYLCRVYGIAATEPGAVNYQSVLSMLLAAIMGRGAFYYITMAAIVAVLCLSANTSFADFPRLCRVLADDRYLPGSFAVRGRRLVYSQGIVALAVLAGALLVGFGGITDRLIPLFAIGAFLAFTLSQAGMVVHWRRAGGQGARVSLAVNLAGALATGITLVVVVVSKFGEGAWLTVLVVPLLLYAFVRVNRHYLSIAAQIATIDPLELPHAREPIAVIAAGTWNKMVRHGIQFAMRQSREVHVVLVKTERDSIEDFSENWKLLIECPLHAAQVVPPRLVVLTSRYRQFFTPFVDYVLQLEQDNQERDVFVIIPDLVMTRWYSGILHNNRGAILRTLLRLRGGSRLVIVDLPYRLKE